MRGSICVAAGIAAVVLAAPASAQVADPVYQGFLTQVCTGGGAMGNLAVLCGVAGGNGNVSGDSEVSLDPGQTLIAADVALARAQALAKATERRLEGLRDEAAGKPGAAAAAPAARFGNLSLFVNGQYEWFEQRRTPARSDERSFDGDVLRGTFGFDYRASPQGVLGMTFGFARTDSTITADAAGRNFVPQADAGGTEARNYSVTLFGSYNITPQLFVDGSFGLGRTDYELRRNSIFQETTRVVPQTNVNASANTSGRETTATLGVGYDLNFGAWSVGPYVRGRYTRSRVEGYTETDLSGSGLALIVSDTTSTSLTSVVGARVSYPISTSFGVIVPQARAEFEHEFRDNPRTTTSRFLLDGAGPSFGVTTDGPDRNYFNLGAGAVLILPNGWMPFIDVEGLVGYSDYDRVRVTAGLRVEF
jgi:outer membrane autotransporter protein